MRTPDLFDTESPRFACDVVLLIRIYSPNYSPLWDWGLNDMRGHVLISCK